MKWTFWQAAVSAPHDNQLLGPGTVIPDKEDKFIPFHVKIYKIGQNTAEGQAYVIKGTVSPDIEFYLKSRNLNQYCL